MNYNRIEDPGPPEKHLKINNTSICHPDSDASPVGSTKDFDQRMSKEITHIKVQLSDLEKKTDEILDILKADE